MLSRPAQYAILAMAYLAQQPVGKLVTVRRIGAEAGIPRPFLAKILGNLTRHGLLFSRRGPNGGVALVRNPSDIRISDILRVFDEPVAIGGCYLGFEQCSDERPCPMHGSWKPVRTELARMLDEKRLSDVAETRRDA